MRTVGQGPAGGLPHPVASSVKGAQESTPLCAQDTGLPALRPEPSSAGNFGTIQPSQHPGCPVPSQPLPSTTLHPNTLSTSWDLPIRPHLTFLSTQTQSTCLWGRPSDHLPPLLPAPRLESARSPSPPLPLPPSGPTPSLGPSSPQITPPAPRSPGSQASLTREGDQGFVTVPAGLQAPLGQPPAQVPSARSLVALPSSQTALVPPLHFHLLPCPASVSHASCEGEPSSMPGAPPAPSLPPIPSLPEPYLPAAPVASPLLSLYLQHTLLPTFLCPVVVFIFSVINRHC